jgi:isoleucyl-tRNA synthetase
LGRRRFWKNDDAQDKLAAYQTLYTCLKSLSILAAPIAPFYMDRLFLDLTQGREGESVHLADFPRANTLLINAALEEEIDLAQKITSLVLSLRKKEKIRVRQPLSRILIPDTGEPFKSRLNRVAALIKSEVNVKAIEWMDGSTLVKQVKPNFKTIGPKYGNQMKAIAAWVNGLGSEDIQQIEQDQGTTLTLDGTTIELEISDFEITTKDVPGWVVATEGSLTVALDIEISEELAQEGIAREVVNRLQNARKDAGLEVTDRVVISYCGSETVTRGISAFSHYIAEEVLAKQINHTPQLLNGTNEEILAADDFIFTLTKD